MSFHYDSAALIALFITIAAVVDFRWQRIPNWLTVPAAVLGLVYNLAMPHGIGVLPSLAGFAIGFSLLLLPWILGGGGMGDVKMLAALGAWVGPLAILTTFALGAVLAAFGMIVVLSVSAVAQGFAVTRRRYATVGGTVDSAVAQKRRRILPFAIPMAASTWLFLGWLLLRAYA
jgi:prepilin peptidase CpaA